MSGYQAALRPSDSSAIRRAHRPLDPCVYDALSLRPALQPRARVQTARKNDIHTTRTIGKYVVSPLTSRTDESRFTASVSIRSGQGSTTHDRVLRLLPLFDCADTAARYAMAQGLAWLRQHRSAA